MHIVLRLFRDDAGEELVRYDLPDDAGIDWSGASVTTALQFIQKRSDPDLAYAISCRRGLCNICAMRIDGVVQTACVTPLRDGMVVEASKRRLMLRDTVVELSLVRQAREI